jgi:hypothetical protein
MMMPVNLVNARKCVQAFDFTRLIGMATPVEMARTRCSSSAAFLMDDGAAASR